MARRRKPIDLKELARLQGARLLLRPPALADADAVYAYASDPAVTRFLAWPRHRALSDSRLFVERAIQDWQNGNNPVWLIEDQDGVVGSIGARLSVVNAGIGYALGRECWGRGYATEALRLVNDALARHSSVLALWALCVTENAASVRVLEKGGFRYARTLDSYFSCPNLNGAQKNVFLYTCTLDRDFSQEMT